MPPLTISLLLRHPRGAMPPALGPLAGLRCAALLLGLAVLAGSAGAQDRAEPGARGHRGGPPGLVFDQRHHHDHYYPSRGYLMPALPGGAMALTFGGRPYHFHGGVWFSPRGGRYVVVMPPLGIVIPVLPPAYVSLWFGGGRYFYANGVYYAPVVGGYSVVAPPPNADAGMASSPPPMGTPPATPAAPATPKPPPEPVIYPRNGQSATQTEGDRQECNRWATTVPAALAEAEVFQRAIAACMDGRGYTVR
ncbi:MAG: DUF6515 family protein [Betaproteobacteria bacterium]